MIGDGRERGSDDDDQRLTSSRPLLLLLLLLFLQKKNSALRGQAHRVLQAGAQDRPEDQGAQPAPADPDLRGRRDGRRRQREPRRGALPRLYLQNGHRAGPFGGLEGGFRGPRACLPARLRGGQPPRGDARRRLPEDARVAEE